jgi:hypothetical protein
MKKISYALSLSAVLFLCACNGNSSGDTSTDMPDSGYELRTDTMNNSPITSDAPPRGAVGIDSIHMGQTHVAGATDSTSNQEDSTNKR